MIEYLEYAAAKGISEKQFKKDALTTVACLGAVEIDRSGDAGSVLRFTCHDKIGELEVIVRRVRNASN